MIFNINYYLPKVKILEVGHSDYFSRGVFRKYFSQISANFVDH